VFVPRGELARCLLAALGVWLGVWSAACRIEPEGARWLEAHGDVNVREIAASSRGLEAIGMNRHVYHYPGAWVTPWVESSSTQSLQLAASALAVYLLDEQGAIWRVPVSGTAVRWEFSLPWQVTDLAVDELDRVYAISHGRIGRVDGDVWTALGCALPARSVSASTDGVYVVSEDGRLWLTRGSSCDEVKTPGPLTSVAAHRGKLAIASQGTAYIRRRESWHALPRPVLYRDTGLIPTTIETVALSQNTLWAKGTEAHVLMLSERP
jgi:hypothetical protein